MNEREKREKVIANLAILRTWAAVNPDYGIGLSVVDCIKAVKWLDDAIELLKAQEPRVMTPAEIGALKRGDVVWYEQHAPEEDYIQPMVADGGSFIGNADMGVKLCYLGPCERLWTAEPTDEQRRAVKWE